MDEQKVNELPERLAISTIIPLKIESAPFQILQQRQDHYLNYSSSVVYEEVLNFLQVEPESLQNLAFY